MESYGTGTNITVSRYVNTNNIAVLLDDGRYDVLTTNGEVLLVDTMIGIQSDEDYKIKFALENDLINTDKPTIIEPAGFIHINYYPITDKLQEMVDQYDSMRLKRWPNEF